MRPSMDVQSAPQVGGRRPWAVSGRSASGATGCTVPSANMVVLQVNRQCCEAADRAFFDRLSTVAWHGCLPDRDDRHHSGVVRRRAMLNQPQQRLVLWAMPLGEKRLNIDQQGLPTRG